MGACMTLVIHSKIINWEYEVSPRFRVRLMKGIMAYLPKNKKRHSEVAIGKYQCKIKEIFKRLALYALG